jgi:ribosomal protein L9
MFRALGRWFKAIGYLFTGQIDSARRVLDTNPHVVRAKYDTIIRDKVGRIHTYKQAVAGLIAQQENKMAAVKRLTGEVQNLERLKAGALAKAKQTVERLQAAGKPEAEVKSDEEYKRCLAAFNDFSTTLAEKQDHIAENEKDIGTYRKTIGDHKVQLQQLLREVDKLRAEAHDSVADIITAKQEKTSPICSPASPRTAPPRNFRACANSGRRCGPRPASRRNSPAPTPRPRKPSSSNTPAPPSPTRSSTAWSVSAR